MAVTQSKHPVLPKLKKQRQTAGFDERGIWSARQAIALDQLSEDLDIVKVGIDINSIPDMWARPLLFEMALFQPYHLLGPRVVGEWRGLPAMLALREVSDINALTVTQIKLPGLEEALDAKSSLRDADFLKTLARLAPTRTVSSDTSWRELYVILNDDAAIGMTSPTTLVTTATHYFGRIDSNQVPWFNGKLLLDPTGKTNEEARNFLSEPVRDALSWWLNGLRDELRNQSVTNGGAFDARSAGGNALVTKIDEYIADVGAVRRTFVRGAGYGMTSGIFAVLDRPVMRSGGDPRDSDVLLISSRRDDWLKRDSLNQANSDLRKKELPVEAFRAYPAILIVDEEISKQWRNDPKDLLVWSTTSLQNALPYGGFDLNPPDHKNEYLGTNGLKGEVWSPKWLFKRQLHVVRNSNAFPRTVGINIISANQELTYANEMVTPILPFDRLLIDQLTVDDLATRISFEQRPEGILVRLKLDLSGPQRNGRSVEFTRLYRADQGEIRLIEDVPLLVVWPDFRAAQGNWKANYTYYDGSQVRETFSAKPYVPGIGAGEEKSLTAGRKAATRVTRTDSYPEAMLCSVNGAKDEVGFLLVQQPNLTEKAGLSFRVGVDFGATGTNVYFRAGEQTPEAFKFSERYVFVTSVAAERQATMFDIALPARTEPTPFLSFFRTFPNVPLDTLRPLLDGIIHFPEGGKVDNNSSITYNLKWSGREEDSLKVEAFLKQICLQVATEAMAAGASVIDWSFSFPTAFSRKRKKAFVLIWEKVISWCAILTGIAATPDSPRSCTESEASTSYFRDPLGHRAATPTGAVCIDIGGSTSDIGIWQGELRWQTSLRLAGREIFLNFLFANPDLLGRLSKEIDITALRQARERGRAVFYAQADAMLRGEGSRLFERIPHFAEQPQLAELEQTLALGIAGIFYYVGLLVNYLRDRGIYSLEVPRFYIGGNGSRMFQWLNMGKPFHSDAGVSEIFKAVFLHASGLSQSPLIIEISSRPKAEAAFGLICGTQLREGMGDNEKEHDEKVLAGESFILKGHDKSWNKTIDAKTFQDLSEPRALDRISDFLESFDQAARHCDISPIAAGNAWREALIKKVRIGLATAIEEAKEEGEDGIEVEPIFILALKSLLGIVIEKKT